MVELRNGVRWAWTLRGVAGGCAMRAHACALMFHSYLAKRRMPRVGLGTFKALGTDVVDAVKV